MYVIGFNGPPQCGKDTLARFFVEEMEKRHPMIPIREVSLSTPLRKVAYAMVGLTYDPAHPFNTDYEEFKRTHFPQFDRTGRELMIDVSERFLKLCYGQPVMAQMLLADIPEWMFDTPCMILIRDSGFQCEVDPLIERVGAENFLVCHVHRQGYDSFKNDSREWVTHPLRRMNTEILNEGTLDDLRTEAARLYGRCVNQKGWKF